MKLIDKDAVVAEIEKWRDGITKGIFSIPLTGRDRASATFEYEILGRIKDFLNTLEVKDLELTWEDIKEICDIAFEEACRLQRNMKGSRIYKEQHYQEVLKRFKAQKGE